MVKWKYDLSSIFYAYGGKWKKDTEKNNGKE